MNDFSGFVVRHVGASLVGAVGVISLALGYADQADTIATDFEPWQLQALGAALVIIFIFLVLFRIDNEYLKRTRIDDVGLSDPNSDRLQRNSELGAMPFSPDPSTLASELQVVLPDFKGRIFLPANFTPKHLMQICKGKTDVHARKVIEPYLGKWMRYCGIVYNVHAYGDKVIVRFRTDDLTSIKAEIAGDCAIADVLHVGDRLEIVGKVSEIDSVSVAMEDATIVDR